MAILDCTKENPWILKTPPGSSQYTMHVDEKDGQTVLVCTVGKTALLYDAGQRRHGGSLGSVGGESGWRVVWG